MTDHQTHDDESGRHQVSRHKECTRPAAKEEAHRESGWRREEPRREKKRGVLDLVLGLGHEPVNFLPVASAERHDLSHGAALRQAIGPVARDPERVLAHCHQFRRLLEHEAALGSQKNGNDEKQLAPMNASPRATHLGVGARFVFEPGHRRVFVQHDELLLPVAAEQASCRAAVKVACKWLLK